MECTPLLSVIVPVYNVETYLSRCVDSVLNQTYPHLEVILVDDGATDSSGMICDAYAQKDHRVKVIHKENGGLSSARNAGLDICQGEYVAFVDSDDWVEPDAYEKMLALAKSMDVKLVCAGRYDVSGRTGEKKVGLCPPKTERISSEELVGRIFTWNQCDSSACDKLYHRTLLENWRFPAGKVCEDVPVMYRIILQTDWVAVYNQPVYNYFHRHGSITTAKLSEKTFHFSQHTAMIYSFIKENYPSLKQEARYLRVRSLIYNVQSIVLSEQENRTKFADQYRQSRMELMKHILFILTSPFFGAKERVMDFLMISGVYRNLRKMRNALRQLFAHKA